MASHQFAIAKASFSAGLLRPDPASISRDDITHFHSLLEKAISQCSPVNIQVWKIHLLARITSLGKYLAAFSASFAGQVVGAHGNTPKPSSKRKRLHILYLLNDLLFHAKFRDGTSSAYSSLTAKLQAYLVDLFSATASFRNCPKHQKKVDSLLGLWEANGYYSRDYINKLREAVRIAANAESMPSTTTTGEQDDGNILNTSKTALGRDAPFVMPAMHGDLSAPYYDLPAGNLMPHIIPNSVAPINPHLVKPLQFVAGPADQKLAIAVKAFLRDVEEIFGNDRFDGGAVRDVDELGLPILHGEGTGELTGTDGYYGWSRAFCEKMKDRRKEKKSRGQGRRGRSESRSEGLTPRKRRRYSYSESSRSRSWGRTQPYSRSRSISNERSESFREGKNSLPPKARGYPPRSKSPSGRYKRGRSRSHSRSRSRSYSPPLDRPNFQQSYPSNSNATQSESFQSSQASPPPPPLPYPVQYQQGFSQLAPPTGPRGMPIPPPHPPLQQFHGQHPIVHSGPWPPPPPPPPNISFYQQGSQYPLQQGYAPPPPPPWGAQQAFEGGAGGYSGYVYQGSPAMSQQQQQQQQNNSQGFDDYRSVKGREIGARRGWKT
ncbi:hypothetical protein FGG08_000038 [Glutinoglossum americanum]|uniref:CID domain-containing protein n=1 Tax=Glutinoglossum americanum TaxID=1670608 RepID=A0A9P8IGZ6_9PEZI|nr:hypothetical protein FGG08_000038 [Glutinoglossum americanum]